MSRRWIVVDTNIFCHTDYRETSLVNAHERDRFLVEGSEALEFLRRVIEHCEVYGLAIDAEGLILEEYEKKIPRGSFGYYAFVQMADRIPEKKRYFQHKNPGWLKQMQRSEDMDKHDRRFLATALATPDKLLVSEDSVFHQNAALLQERGLSLYSAERANATL